MLYLVLSILFSVLLLVNFRLHPKYNIDTTQAIVFNYWVCVLLGWFLLPTGTTFTIDWSADITYYSLLLGLGFIVVFMLSGASTLQSGITVTSLANNMSLVIPVLFNLWVFNTTQSFGLLNYIGLGLAFVAVYLSTWKKKKTEDIAVKNNRLTLPLLVFLMYGLTNTAFNYLNLKYVTASGTTIAFMLTACLGAVVSGLFLLIYQRKSIVLRNVIAAIPLGIPNFLSFYFLLKALDVFKNNGAYVLPVYIGVIVVSACVALFFFKEKLAKRNWIGLVLALVAIVLISWMEV